MAAPAGSEPPLSSEGESQEGEHLALPQPLQENSRQPFPSPLRPTTERPELPRSPAISRSGGHCCPQAEMKRLRFRVARQEDPEAATVLTKT